MASDNRPEARHTSGKAGYHSQVGEIGPVYSHCCGSCASWCGHCRPALNGWWSWCSMPTDLLDCIKSRPRGLNNCQHRKAHPDSAVEICLSGSIRIEE